MNTLYRCDIVVEEDAVEYMWGLLALHISYGWEEESLATGETRFRVHCESRDFIEDLATKINNSQPMANIDICQIPNEDWTKAWREFFTPIICGSRFIVLPPWLENSTDLEGRKPVLIEPKSAFGTGHHNTTALCLKVISDLLDSERIVNGMEFLDLGTGSGILGLGCCQYGLYGIGTDIDQLAVDNALENKILNKIVPYDSTQKKGFDALLGSVEIVSERKFDLVLANILAKPLKELAPDIVKLCKKNVCLVLSGLLVVQAKDVEAAYMAEGLPPARMVVDGDWAALVWA